MGTDMKKYVDYINNLSGNILLGCDGFIDEVFEIVDVRESLTEYTAIDVLKNLGELIVKRADGGIGLEIVEKRRCSGGFTPNVGRVPAILGLNPTMLGLYGENEIDSAFEEFKDNSTVISLGDSALTLVFEFTDGKLMMSAIKTVANLTWNDIVAHFGEEGLKELFAGQDIVGLGYWSFTPDFENILKGYIAQFDAENPPKRMFFDLADVKKKTEESLRETLKLLKKYNEQIPMSLSLNEHEGADLFALYGMKSCIEEKDKPAQVAADLAQLREVVGIDEIVVHTPHFGAVASATEGEAYALQEHQTNVIRTAGAGDSFNGGYVSASLGDLSLKERLVIANATTAFFVTHATTPNKEEMIAQIEKASDK